MVILLIIRGIHGGLTHHDYGILPIKQFNLHFKTFENHYLKIYIYENFTDIEYIDDHACKYRNCLPFTFNIQIVNYENGKLEILPIIQFLRYAPWLSQFFAKLIINSYVENAGCLFGGIVYFLVLAFKDLNEFFNFARKNVEKELDSHTCLLHELAKSKRCLIAWLGASAGAMQIYVNGELAKKLGIKLKMLLPYDKPFRETYHLDTILLKMIEKAQNEGKAYCKII